MVSHGGSLHTEIRRGGGQGFKWKYHWQTIMMDGNVGNIVEAMWNIVEEIKHHLLALIDHLTHKRS